AQFQTWVVAAPVLAHRLGAVGVEGRVVAIDAEPEGVRLVIEPSHIDRLDPAELPAKVRLRLRTDTGIRVGAKLALHAVLLPPPAPAMPGAYDFQRRAWFDRIGAVGFVIGPPELRETPTSRFGIEALRDRVTARIRAALPGDRGDIASALITGSTHAIAPALSGTFRDAGLAHILVIAGLHMGMVAGFVFFAVRAGTALIPRFALNYPTKKWAAGAALLATFFYLLLSGATVPSRRAFAMTGLALLAILVDRLSFSPRAIALAAMAVLLMTPESAAGPSFQMSFAAVAALIAFYEAMSARIADWHRHSSKVRRVWLYLGGIVMTTLVTTVATMPFTIYHFNRVPLYSIAANVVAVPVTGFWVMPWAVISLVLMPLGLEAWGLTPMSWGIGAIATMAEAVTSWPGAVLTVPSMPAAGLALVGVGGAWLVIWQRRWRFLGLAPVMIGFATLLLVRPPDLLIAEDGRLIAVRSSDGNYSPSHERGPRLTEETWTRHAALTLGSAWPARGMSADEALRCDALGCLYRRHGAVVAFIRQGNALPEDCAAA
ncbi:MAG TPA: ComEC/Rec2 family competence protein, partial [Stellaceae bacterium]|nr:ComEC/Rec2 family competence protein [Stellaceae bacterium]